MTNSRAVKLLKAGTSVTHTIATGIITWTRISSYLKIDTESAGATDDLITINGGNDGDIIIVQSTSSARVPTLKDASDNLELEGDFIMTHSGDKITLININGTAWHELARSNNVT